MGTNESKIGKLVSDNAAKFGANAKLAADLAAMLDGDLLDLTRNRNEEIHVMALGRLKLMASFRSLCLAAGVSPPRFEEWPLLALISEPTEIALRDADEARARIRREVEGLPESEAVSGLLSLERTIGLLPSLVTEHGASRPMLLARIDLLLLRLGKEPLGLLAGGAEGSPRSRLPEPARTLKVLIVDDRIDDIIKTFSALAGSPGLEIGCLRVQLEWGADRQAALQQTAAAVLAEKPDIVLMDQGMSPISGSDLIRAIGEMETGSDRVVFVGNTGGSPEVLNEAGAIGNCRKGEDISPVRQAIRMLASQ